VIPRVPPGGAPGEVVPCTAIEPSDEIRGLLLDVVSTYASRRGDAWAALWSDRAGALDLGTDAREWWAEFDTLVSLFNAQADERAGISFHDPEAVAFQEGSVGWGVYAATALHRGRVLPLRFTVIFHLERGAWKVVHIHRSIAARNEEALGLTLPTTLDVMTAAVRRERPDVTRAAAPNGTVTILFSDIESSTPLAEELGDQRWVEVLRCHNAIVRAETLQHRGYEVKSEGDGFMLAFSSANDGLRCAIGIQRALAQKDCGVPLRVRIGLHTGEAIRERDDFFGKVVILAARIAAEARGTEILVSSLVRDLTESVGEFRFESTTEVELKGLSGIHRLHSMSWRSR
jgi:class 3 adenylate cyclase